MEYIRKGKAKEPEIEPYSNDVIYNNPETRELVYLSIKNGLTASLKTQTAPFSLNQTFISLDFKDYSFIKAFSYFSYYENDREEGKYFNSFQEFISFARNKSPGATMNMVYEEGAENSRIVYQDGTKQTFHIQAIKNIYPGEEIVVLVRRQAVQAFSITGISPVVQKRRRQQRSPTTPESEPESKIQRIQSPISPSVALVLPKSGAGTLKPGIQEEPVSLHKNIKSKPNPIRQSDIRDPSSFRDSVDRLSDQFQDLYSHEMSETEEGNYKPLATEYSSDERFVLRLSPPQKKEVIVISEDEGDIDFPDTRKQLQFDSPKREKGGSTPLKKEQQLSPISPNSPHFLQLNISPKGEGSSIDSGEEALFIFSPPKVVKNADSVGNIRVSEAPFVVSPNALTQARFSIDLNVSEEGQLSPVYDSPYKSPSPRREKSPDSPDEPLAQNYKTDDWYAWFEQTTEGIRQGSSPDLRDEEEEEKGEQFNTEMEEETEVSTPRREKTPGSPELSPERIAASIAAIDITSDRLEQEPYNEPLTTSKYKRRKLNLIHSGDMPKARTTAVQISVPRGNIAVINLISDSESEGDRPRQRSMSISPQSSPQFDSPIDIGVLDISYSPVREGIPGQSNLLLETMEQERVEKESESNIIKILKTIDSRSRPIRSSPRVSKQKQSIPNVSPSKVMLRHTNLDPKSAQVSISIDLNNILNRKHLICSIRKSNSRLQPSINSSYRILSFATVDKILLCLIQKFDMGPHSRFLDLNSGYGNVVFHAAIMYRLAAAHGVDMGLQGDPFDIGNQVVVPLDKVVYYCSIMTADAVRINVPQVRQELDKVVFYFGDQKNLILKDYTHLVSFNSMWGIADFHGVMDQLLSKDSKMVVFACTKKLHSLVARRPSDTVSVEQVDRDKALISLIKQELTLQQELTVKTTQYESSTMFFYTRKGPGQGQSLRDFEGRVDSLRSSMEGKDVDISGSDGTTVANTRIFTLNGNKKFHRDLGSVEYSSIRKCMDPDPKVASRHGTKHHHFHEDQCTIS